MEVMNVRGVMNPTVSIYQICARGSTPDFDSCGARAPCGVVIDRLLRVWFPLLMTTASLADASARRSGLAFDRAARGVIMDKEEGKSSGNFGFFHFCNRNYARFEWTRIAEERGLGGAEGLHLILADG